MLDCSSTNLRAEVDAAIERRKKRTDQAREIIRAYRGDPSASPQEPTQLFESYENIAWEFERTVGAKLLYSNPAVSIDMGGVVNGQTRAMQAGMNSLIRSIQLARKLRRVRLDMMFGFGVAEVYLEPTPGWDAQRDQLDRSDLPASVAASTRSGALRPNIARVSPARFALDWAADYWEDARFYVKTFVWDRDDLITARNPLSGRPIFDEKVVKSAALDAGLDEVRKNLVDDGIEFNQLTRKSVVGYEVYVPESGMIYTLPFSPIREMLHGGYLRPPRRYAGPRSGPFVVFGIADEPEVPYPMSPLKPLMPLMREINAIAGKTSRDAVKSGWRHFMDGTDAKLLDDIVNADDHSFFIIPGLAGRQIQSIELGGASEKSYYHLDRLRARADRQLGLSDAIKGQPQGDNTASADIIAERSFDTRVRDSQQVFREAVVSLLEKLGHFMWFNPQVRFAVPYEEGGKKEQWTFRGGFTPEEVQAGADPSQFNALDITIQPYSMEPVDHTVLQRREVDKLTILANKLPPPSEAPRVWEAVLNDYGEAHNQKGLGTRLIGLLQQDLQAMIQQAAAAAAASGAGVTGGSGSAGPAATGEGTEAVDLQSAAAAA